ATTLWPESDQREGRARLRRTLYRLTQAIGDDILDSGTEAIRLQPTADLWLDSAAFRKHATAGLSAAPQDVVAPARLAHLNAAVALYTGDFLAGFTLPDGPAFDEWQFFQRESLRQLYGQVLEQLVQAYRTQQNWEEAIAYARRWLALDGLYEPAHRMLMRLYAWAGQHAAALRQYQECTRLLGAELGAVPEDETTALYEAIRTRQLGPAATAPPVETPRRGVSTGGVPATPIAAQRGEEPSHTPPAHTVGPLFVARQRELRWLDDLLDTALEGQHGVAFVVGEAGQGKTALLRTFARSAQAAHPDLVVAWGSCNAYTGVGDPYLPFREILELLTGNVEVDALASQLHRDHASRLWHTLPAAAQALVNVGPDLLDTFVPTRGLLRRAAAYPGGEAPWVQQLQELVARKATRPTDPRQQDLFEQYAKVMQDLARRPALLLILDDLQWGDRGSTDLLLHLGRRLKGCRVLIVGAYRPADVAIGRGGERHPLERVVGELQRDFGEIQLDLGQAEGRLLVDSLLDAEPNQLNEAFRAALYQQTGGHPLFTIELLSDMQERGELARDAAGRWTASPHLHWTRLPARIEGVIGERVGRLNARLREVLQVASVEGEEFTAEVVARVVGADEQTIVRQLSRELDQAHHLVRALGVRCDDGLRLSRYRFQHNLIQRYLYHSLDDVERVYQHEAVGHALEGLYGTQAAEIAAQLARHFAAAQMPAKATVYSEQAGDQARRSAALAEAVQYYQTSLAAWPPADLAGRAPLLRKLGECQWLRGLLEDALAPFEASYALYESLGNQEGAGAVQRLLGRLRWEMGDRERALGHYYQALALLEVGPESVELARTISSISEIHMIYSAYDQAITWGQRALSMAERLAAEHVVVQALVNLGSAYFATGDAERGQAMLRHSWQRGVELDLPHDACRAAYNLGVCLTDLGRPPEAQAVVEELRAYAVRMQIPMFAGTSLISLAKLDWLTGDWQSARARRQEILAWIGRSQSITYLEVLADTTLAWMYNDVGQAALARRLLEQAQPKVDGRAEIYTTGSHLAQHVRALGMLGCEDEATAAARQFLVLFEQQPGFVDTYMSNLVVCRWFATRAPDLRLELKSSLAQLEYAHTQYGSAVTAAALSEGRGLVALSERDALRAVDHFHHAAMRWQALGRPYDQMRALSDLGRAFLQAGDDVQARTIFDWALSLIGTLAAQLEDPEVRAAFLNSPLVQEVRAVRAGSQRWAMPSSAAATGDNTPIPVF
ncbi:MAG: AAA family ATPase, partial [Chloroflexales bacterium]|nr:AAA family ATPase [Chloroflexales bacterium]